MNKILMTFLKNKSNALIFGLVASLVPAFTVVGAHNCWIANLSLFCIPEGLKALGIPLSLAATW